MHAHADDAPFWDRIAQHYSQKPVDDVPAWQNKLRVHRGLLDPGDRVLDVGCGTGSLCLELAPHVASADGLDVSAEMVRIARDKAVRAGFAHVAFHQGRAQDPGRWPDGHFDVVSAYSLLHLVDDLDGTLRSLWRLTRPGGRLVTSTVVLGQSRVPYGVILPVMRWLGKAPRVSVLRRDHLLERIVAAGFVDAEEVDVGAAPTIAFVLARRPVG